MRNKRFSTLHTRHGAPLESHRYCVLLLAGLLTTGAIAARAQDTDARDIRQDTLPATVSDAPASETTTPETPTSSVAAQTSQARTGEAPITVNAQTKPSLDYEPSETISEDRSVSFPVDI